jgi:hypothetical protein
MISELPVSPFHRGFAVVPKMTALRICASTMLGLTGVPLSTSRDPTHVHCPIADAELIR